MGKAEMTTIRKTYTTEFKVKVVREILREEKSLSQIASEYGTHTNVISRWRDQALSGLSGLFDDRVAMDQAAKEAERKKVKWHPTTRRRLLFTVLSALFPMDL
ncbi:MAG: hypothetical protein NVS4B11_06240 [Ktedonobacteraceae bacterium]